jgi:hypothetical protein
VGSIEAQWNEYTSGYRIEVEHVTRTGLACNTNKALKCTFLRSGFKRVC